MAESDRLKGIEVFVQVAEAGGFSAAADRLNITSSAVGKSVARLEARLNTRLFVRTTRSLSLTDAGAAFYTSCVRALAELKEAEAVLTSHPTEPVGLLNVNVPVAFGRLKVLPLVLRFMNAHPQLRVHLSFTDRFIDMAEESIDVAVRIGGSDNWHASLAHQNLGTERVIFCAAPAYLKRRGEPRTEADLAAHECIVYGKADGTTIPWRFANAAGYVERRSMESRIIVGHGEAQMNAVKYGFGVSQLATWLIEDELKSGELIEILPALATTGSPLDLVWLRSRQLQPKVHGLVHWLAGSLLIS
jgi:DNA-binding transcriptional LysR family regulator